MLCLVGMWHAPAPSHHRLLPRANSCLALFPNPQLPPCAIPHLNPYSLTILTLLTYHPHPTHLPSSPYSLTILTLLAFHHSPYSLSITLPTHIPSLSLCTFHPFVVSTLALSNSSHVSFHGVRTKTFSTHVTTQIGPDVRETGLFTHGRASLNFTVIPMFTSDVAMPCPCGVWQ